jgi:hypothetical protein
MQNTFPKSKAKINSISMPRVLLHLEGLALLTGAVLAYWQLQPAAWWLFIVLLLTPDLLMVGYFVNPKYGAIGYNLVHTIIVPFIVLGFAIFIGSSWGLAIGLIMLAHIGIDRTLGYGLKYVSNFKETHLNRV